MQTEGHREAGPVHVGRPFWQRLELDRILRDVGLSEHVAQLVCVFVLNRLIAPKAELAIPDWVRSTALGDLLGRDFEGLAQANPKAKRAYSRDTRPDCKQVVLGLAVNRDGFALFHEVFEANAQDRTTLETMIHLLEHRARRTRHPSGLHRGAPHRQRRGPAHPQGLHPRARPQTPLRPPRHPQPGDGAPQDLHRAPESQLT